jgi:hypothetical protein
MKLIPLATTRELLGPARRTWIVRVAAAAGLIVLAVAAVLVSRHPRTHEVRFLPSGSNGIVVLDLSASISSDTYSRIGQTVSDLSKSRGRYGLVVFSDSAYEALPPGSPASAFQPLVRFFTLPKQTRPGVQPQFPANPWSDSFSAGTKISTGLDLARSILIGNRLARPAVLLISDLDDDPSDLPNLGAVATAYKQEGIGLNIVGLNPSTEDEQLFQKFVAGSGTLSHAQLPGEGGQNATGTPFPWTLALIALALIGLLALNELWSARLTWREA